MIICISEYGYINYTNTVEEHNNIAVKTELFFPKIMKEEMV